MHSRCEYSELHSITLFAMTFLIHLIIKIIIFLKNLYCAEVEGKINSNTLLKD